MKLTKYGLFIGALGLLASCSNDNVDAPVGGGDSMANHDGETTYLNISVAMPSVGTRAGNPDLTQDGEAAEYAVDDAKLYLFSAASEAPNGPSECVAVINLEGNFGTDGATDITSSKSYTKVAMPTGITSTSTYYALVILNTEQMETLPYVGTTWTDWSKTAQTKMVDDITAPTKFAMTNALGWTGTVSGDPTVLVPVSSSNFYYESDTQDGETVNIYVQRGVSKVTIDGDSQIEIGEKSNVKNSDDTVTLSNWWLDVTNTTTLPVQTLDYLTQATNWWNASGSDLQITDWSSLSSPATRFTGGTSFTRLFWGVDPNYNTTGEFNLVTTAPTTTSNGKDAKLYCYENTFDVAHMIQNQSTRVMFKGTYDVDGTPGSFVSYNGLYAAVTKVKTGLDKSYSASDSENGKALKDIIDDETELASVAAALNLPVDSDTKVNFHLNGEVYYTVIVRHFDNDELGVDDGWELKSDTYPANNEKILLGRFGMLRNNWYELNLNSISGPGEPTIPEPGDTPDDDPAKLLLDVKINILTWAKRSQQVDW